MPISYFVSPLVSKACIFAQNKHSSQLDDTGKSYFKAHIQQVVQIVYQVTQDSEILAAAYLHDTLEDTDTTYKELVEEFGERVAYLVNELTHDGEKDSKGYYFPRLKSREAIMIKFADRLSNISRMESWDEQRRMQYVNKSKFWKSK